MKKLMTLLSAATVAIGLQAADYTDTGTSFEGAARGAFDITTADDLGSNVTGLWSTNGSDTVTLEVTDDQSCIRPAPGSTETDWPWQYNEWSQTNSLAIKTTFGNPVTRKVQGSGYAFGLDDRESFYFDSFVKFTAFDDDPMNTAVTNDFGDAKIAVWAQEVTLEGGALQTNVFVRAGYIGGQPQSYNCGRLDDPEGWHRLTIKFIKNVYYLDQTKPSTPCFVVFVDGGWRTDSSANKRGLDEGLQASMYAGFYNTGALFPSLDQATPDKSGLKSVSFDGQGSIDDLVFTKTAPFAAAGDGTDAVATFNGENYATMTDLVAAVNIASEEVLAASTVKLFSDYNSSVNDILEFNNARGTIKIDLNGHTVYGLTTEGYPVWIVDSSADQAGAVTTILSVGDNSKIGAGTYGGGQDAFVVIGVGTELLGGRFSTNDCDVATLNSADYTRPAGYEFVLGTGDDEGYFVLYADPWVEYLGVPVDGAYTIDDYTDLTNFQAGVAAGLTTVGVTFKQTANIDMTGEPAFAGIGEYQKVPTAGTPFLGTYDGQNYMISNVKRADGDTQGIFNQVGPSGVIENLVVSNMTFAATPSVGSGFAIVGNAGGGATLRNLTAAGTFASAELPSSHNIAGIVVRVSGGATADVATTIDSCTNNATIYGGYTKLGGICAIAQQQSGFSAGKVVFSNCANNGSLVCKRTAADVTGNAGIVGYVAAQNVELTGCYGNGVITNSDGANTNCDGALVGTQYKGYTLKDNGGNSAPANKKMIASYGNQANVTGFQYATVENGKATTVTTLAAGNTYLLEGDAAPAFEFTAAGTIAFDTVLGYTLDGTGITHASGITGLTVSSNTVGTVTTYTAAGGSGTPVYPGNTAGSYDSAEAATNACAIALNDLVAAPAVVTALGQEAAAAYLTNFTANVVVNADTGKYDVVIDLKPAVEEYLQDEAEDDAADFIANVASEKVTIDTMPGFYYTLEYGPTVGGMTEKSCTLATGSTLELNRPTTPGATAGFYKVRVTVEPILIQPSQD